MLFDTALDGYWLARERDFSPNTVQDYSGTFRRFQAYVGPDRQVEDITSNDIHQFLNFLQRKRRLSNKSLANAWMALSSFWTWVEIELNCSHISADTSLVLAISLNTAPIISSVRWWIGFEVQHDVSNHILTNALIGGTILV
jgi:site-specific recombinase XerD